VSDDEPIADGVAAATATSIVDPDLGEDELAHLIPVPSAKSRARRIIEILATVAVIAAIFGFAFPRVAGSNYSKIWDQLRHLAPRDIAILFVIWFVNLYAYTPVLTNTLPGLTHNQALTVNLAGSAVSNTVPFGGAVGVGATYAIYQSWGHRVTAITRSILVSGFWNVFVKLGLPVVALVLLVFDGHLTTRLVVGTTIGLIALAAAITLLVLVLRSDRFATAIGGFGERLVSKVLGWFGKPPVTGWADGALEFRHESASLIRRRWLHISFWAIVFNLGQFAILLLSLRMLHVSQHQLGWIEIFAAFTIGRLFSAIPLTPSGVGFVEGGLVAALGAFGGNKSAIAAAVLLFSGFTFLLEIPAGAIAWAVWVTKRSWRKA
jgi:uncharacterized membrane protein YbhN (UPF0104 family)